LNALGDLLVSRIFISHSSANNAEAIAVKEWMAGHGWDDVFLDLDPERGLKAGERWQEALKRAAKRCQLVIFLVSPEWTRSKWCLAEFLLAKSLDKPIFAAIVAATPFEELPVEMTAEWQLVDLTAGVRDYIRTVPLPPDPGAPGLSRLRRSISQTTGSIGYGSA
jgi:TIR domain-containing protein